MKDEYKLLAIIVSVFLIGVFLQETIDSSKSNVSKSLEETFEIISELFSVFVALSIFGLTWYAYSKSRDRHSLFLGATFCITGLLILFHLLSYPFMPDFINPNSAHKSAIFFLESRFVLAVLILASVFVHKDSLPKLINKRVIVLFMITILSVFLASGLFREDFLASNNIDGYSTTTALLLLVITIIILVACYLYAKRAKETGQDDLHFLIYGPLIILLSNLVYFFYEISGHFLIITGFFYFHLGLYKSSVDLPYEKLALAEEKLRIGAENKYRNLFDNANDAIITTDLQDFVTSWNHSAEKLFGWEVGNVMGKKLSDLFLLGQSASGIETVHIHETGTRIFVSLTISQLLDLNNKLTGLSFIIHDISQRKKAEDLLIRSKEFTETVLNSMNDAISVIDVNNFRIIDANSVFLGNYEMKKDEVIGKTCHEIIHNCAEPCAPPIDICPLIETLKTGTNSTSELVHYNKGEEKRYFEVSTSPIGDENGKVVSVIHVSRDITERKKSEKLIQDSLHEKETLLREIHHRVKNNMQIISSLLLLQSQNIVDQKYLDIFNDSNNRILSMALIHEKFYQSENLAQINIQEYINDLASNLMGSYGTKGNAELEINVDNIPLNINYAVPCGLILNELITNSLKYAFPKDRHGKIKIIFQKMDGNMIYFSVSDDGIGIPGDMDTRNTKSLGMHLIYTLSENQLHGEITLNRERGTEFQINFKGE
ncbi:MAG: PAS domain S-box protein [Candidatus Methanoperedens sp.]|nr:PAS domain S-box protein [Candidatus Methanoperedens sp.]CAG1008058.1 putative sensor histidine kinase pdtaS [Methanosarcinales archaeon]